MTPRVFAIVGVRLLAIYVFLQGILMVPSLLLIFAFMRQIKATPEIPPPPGLYSGEQFIQLLFVLGDELLLGVALYFYAEKIAQRIVPVNDMTETSSVVSLEPIQAMVFGGVGLWIVIDSLPAVLRMIEYLTRLYSRVSSTNPDEAVWSNVLSIAAPFLQLLLGLVLLFNARSFTNGWRWLRTAGTLVKADRE